LLFLAVMCSGSDWEGTEIVLRIALLCTCNITFRRILTTIVAVDKQ
jgi:hypothetical protein